jgi:hypothetical protein
MSQIAKLAEGTGKPDVETLTGNTGGPVGPDGAFDIRVVGSAGILVVGNPVTHTLTIYDDDLIFGTVTTIGAVTGDCISFPMGITPGTYIISGRLAAYDVTDVAGGGYFFTGAYRTTGIVGLEIDTQMGAEFEETAMAAADFDLLVVGNNIIIQVLGIAGKTIDWSGEFEYQFIG